MVCRKVETLAHRDARVLWHPLTQHGRAREQLAFVRGEGAHLIDEEGNRYIDAIASWWVNLHGHAHPAIAHAIAEQAAKLEHAVFSECTHEPAITLAEELLQALPSGYSRVFYTDNGSTAIECALKMAIQYWYNIGVKRTKVLAFEGGYHGDTFGAMSAAGLSTYTTPFLPYLFEVHTVPPPFHGQEHLSLQALDALLDEEVACLLFEPRIQGAGGMRIYSAEALEPMIALCRERGALVIADEVMTGFGRTGPLFASRGADIVCLSKGITGGFLPLGATVCGEEIFRAFLSPYRARAFLHSHSYCGNPLACAAGLASLRLLKEASGRERIARAHSAFVEKWRGHPRLRRLESCGTILVAEYAVEERSYFGPLRDQLYRYFLKRRILVRPLGAVLYLMPPYCISEEDLNWIYTTIITTLESNIWKNS